MSQQSRRTVLDDLRAMDPYEFERLVAELWGRRGWETELTQRSADRGIDVIASRRRPFPEKQVIQAKRYTSGNNVGSAEIQQYASLKSQVDGADSVLVVTTSDFTPSARELAETLNVKLINGVRLAELLREAEALDLVDVDETEVPSVPSVERSESEPETQSSGNTPIRVEEMSIPEQVLKAGFTLFFALVLLYVVVRIGLVLLGTLL